MKGNNTLVLNTATMLEAVQLWLDANFKNPPIADTVHERNDGGSPSFHVRVKDRPQDASDAAE